jgi:hypothetical protein
MKSISIFAVAVLSACSSASSHPSVSDGGKQGTGTGTGGANTGNETPDASSPVTCATSSLNTAPNPCPANWITALAGYPASCPRAAGGYKARCEPYDTVIYESTSREDFCFFDDATGNLIGAKSITHGKVTCESFDFNFSAPDTTTCTPLGGSKCTDAGP